MDKGLNWVQTQRFPWLHYSLWFLSTKGLRFEREGTMASLKLGSSGPQVTALQHQLAERGFDPGDGDGQFTAATDAAVRAFQQSVGLVADGQAGANTIAALTAPSVTSNIELDIGCATVPRNAEREHSISSPVRPQGTLRCPSCGQEYGLDGARNDTRRERGFSAH